MRIKRGKLFLVVATFVSTVIAVCVVLVPQDVSAARLRLECNPQGASGWRQCGIGSRDTNWVNNDGKNANIVNGNRNPDIRESWKSVRARNQDQTGVVWLPEESVDWISLTRPSQSNNAIGTSSWQEWEAVISRNPLLGLTREGYLTFRAGQIGASSVSGWIHVTQREGSCGECLGNLDTRLAYPMGGDYPYQMPAHGGSMDLYSWVQPGATAYDHYFRPRFGSRTGSSDGGCAGWDLVHHYNEGLPTGWGRSTLTAPPNNAAGARQCTMSFWGRWSTYTVTQPEWAPQSIDIRANPSTVQLPRIGRDATSVTIQRSLGGGSFSSTDKFNFSVPDSCSDWLRVSQGSGSSSSRLNISSRNNNNDEDARGPCTITITHNDNTINNISATTPTASIEVTQLGNSGLATRIVPPDFDFDWNAGSQEYSREYIFERLEEGSEEWTGAGSGNRFMACDATGVDRDDPALSDYAYDSECVEASWFTGTRSESRITVNITEDNNTGDTREGFFRLRSGGRSWNFFIRQFSEPADYTTPGSTGSSPWDNCSGDEFTWLLCPAARQMSHTADGIYNMIASRLQIPVSLIETNGRTYQVWGLFRNMANIVFAILMMVAIISQLTGYGMSNLNIKRMLPRLLVVAILVNLSFFISQLAVDLSNILGSQINSMLTTIASNINPADQGGEVSGALAVGGAGLFIAIVGAFILGGPALGFSILIPLLMSLLGALLAVFFFFAILQIRQVAVVILVIISPLAAVCLLLPQTENLFKKWVSMMKALLVVYPVAALLFAGGKLVVAIINTPPDGSEVGQWSGIMKLVLLVAPLFAVVSVTKASLNGLGAMGAKLTGALSGVRRGATSLAGRGARGIYKSDAAQEKMDKTLAQGRGLFGGKSIMGRMNEGRMNKGKKPIPLVGGAYARAQRGATRRMDKRYSEDLSSMNANNEEYLKNNGLYMAGGTYGDVDPRITNAWSSAEKGDTVALESLAETAVAGGQGDQFFQSLNKTMGSGPMTAQARSSLLSVLNNKEVKKDDMAQLLTKYYGTDNAKITSGADKGKFKSISEAAADTSTTFGSMGMASFMASKYNEEQMANFMGNSDATKAMNEILKSNSSGDRRAAFMSTLSGNGVNLARAMTGAKSESKAHAATDLVLARDASGKSDATALSNFAVDMTKMDAQGLTSLSPVMRQKLANLKNSSGATRNAFLAVDKATLDAIHDDPNLKSKINSGDALANEWSAKNGGAAW